jgi:glycine/D-amino acid oxidase-like deaminating enzyme
MDDNLNKFKPKTFGIIGSGTAGLITALLLRRAFPACSITVVSSSEVGIIGVGEGSTEHWRQSWKYVMFLYMRC